MVQIVDKVIGLALFKILQLLSRDLFIVEWKYSVQEVFVQLDFGVYLLAWKPTE